MTKPSPLPPISPLRAGLQMGPMKIETHNGINTPEANSRAAEAALCRRLPSMGGSDCHKPEQVGGAHTVFDKPISCILTWGSK